MSDSIRERAEDFNAWREYLELQVQLFAPAEIELFGRYGLTPELPSLLDVGCGAGAYARLLKEKLPHLELACVENDRERVEAFRSSLQSAPVSGLSLHQWSVGDEPPPDGFHSCRGALLRYVIQYAKSPGQFLDAVRKAVSPGSPIFIVEEDDGFYHSYPQFEALHRFLEINQRWADAYGSVRDTGRRIPSIVLEAGLKIRHVEVLCQTNLQLDPRKLIRYFELALKLIADSTPSVLSQEEAIEVSRDMYAYVTTTGGKCFFYYPQIITIAEAG